MGKGFLRIQLYVGDYTFHGERTTVLIMRDGQILHTLETDENGTTGQIALESPDITADSPASGPTLFQTYDVKVPAANGYAAVSIYGVQIFDGISSTLNIHLEPYVEGSADEIEIYIPLEHGVDIDGIRDSGTPPEGTVSESAAQEWLTEPPPDSLISPAVEMDPPSGITPFNIQSANEVVIPEFITVHLGTPSANAGNVRVSFRDYIVNVCCSEIYPHWHRNAIIANVHAQVSFALNRLFTEKRRLR